MLDALELSKPERGVRTQAGARIGNEPGKAATACTRTLKNVSSTRSAKDQKRCESQGLCDGRPISGAQQLAQAEQVMLGRRYVGGDER